MRVAPGTLKLRITSTDIVMSPEITYVHLSYEVYHPSGAVVASNKLAARAMSAAHVLEVEQVLIERMVNQFKEVSWQFSANKALRGYSPFDVSLMLEHWTLEEDGKDWKISHPLSGTWEGVTMPAGDVIPKLLDRASAIIARVLPPPVWGWASSPGPGMLEAHCVPVPGAESYAVYNDLGNGRFDLLGTAPTALGGTSSANPGYYRVRMAGVKDGVIGILGPTSPVTVEQPQAAVKRFAGLLTKRERRYK